MVSVFVPGLSVWGECDVFFLKTLNPHSTSLHAGVYMSSSKLLAKPNKLWGSDLQWTTRLLPNNISRSPEGQKPKS